MTATSGPGSSEPFAIYDPSSSCWRTFDTTSDSGSTEFSGTWPKRGSMRSGACTELAMSAPLIDAKGCSSLPTPAAMNPNDGEDVDRWEARRLTLKAKHNNGNGAGTPLSIAVRRDVKIKTLPTPRAQLAHPRNTNIWPRPLDQPQNLENALARIGVPTETPLGDGKGSSDVPLLSRTTASESRPASSSG